MSDYSLKYLKYKQKYLKEIKNQVGGDTRIVDFCAKLKEIFSAGTVFPHIKDYISDTFILSNNTYSYFKDDIDIKYIATFIKSLNESYNLEGYTMLLIKFIKSYKQDCFNKTRLLQILQLNIIF